MQVSNMVMTQVVHRCTVLVDSSENKGDVIQAEQVLRYAQDGA